MITFFAVSVGFLFVVGSIVVVKTSISENKKIKQLQEEFLAKFE